MKLPLSEVFPVRRGARVRPYPSTSRHPPFRESLIRAAFCLDEASFWPHLTPLDARLRFNARFEEMQEAILRLQFLVSADLALCKWRIFAAGSVLVQAQRLSGDLTSRLVGGEADFSLSSPHSSSYTWTYSLHYF